MTETVVDRSAPEVHLRIGDQRLTAGSGGVHGHVNPCTGNVDGTIPMAGQAEIDQAVLVAHEAFQAWRRTPPAKRRQLLVRLADLMADNAAELDRLGTLDNGMSNAGGTNTGLAIEWTRYYAGWCDKLTSDVVGHGADTGNLSFTLAQPYGVIAAVITWNAPIFSIGMKVPPIVAAGNTVVVKPSELTPFTGELFMDLVDHAGFPPGVINMVPGDAVAGEALVTHPLVKKVSFTGGAATATRILQSCAVSIKPVVLELGGKSANIIFEDANLKKAVGIGTMMGCGFMSGQGCNFPTRMLVQRGIYDEVVERVKTTAESIVIGDPFQPGVLAGPVISEAALNRILGMIERAEADGARLITGGRRLGGDLADGFYIAPTVFADVDPGSELAQEEVFGPVLAITPFETQQDAVEIANNSRYGLSGYVHTADLKRALRVAEELYTGEVLVNGAVNMIANRPYGGVGISGVGKEGGRQGIEEFLMIKGVGIAV
ncbi:MAG: aldehyde dehydrogenase family protein [Acidimicrobiales bacterium]